MRRLSSGVRIQATLDAASICSSSVLILYSWSVSAASGAALPLPAAAAAAKDLSLTADALRAAGFTPGAAYAFMLRVWFRGSDRFANDTTVLTALRSDLVVGLRGPSGDVGADRYVQLAAEAADPDDPGTGGFSYVWKCVRPDLGALPCLAGGGEGSADSIWRFGAWQLGALGKPHLLSVTVTKGGWSAGASTSIVPREANTPSGAWSEQSRCCAADPLIR